MCKSEAACVNREAICNSRADCSDYTDESNCSGMFIILISLHYTQILSGLKEMKLNINNLRKNDGL